MNAAVNRPKPSMSQRSPFPIPRKNTGAELKGAEKRPPRTAKGPLRRKKTSAQSAATCGFVAGPSRARPVRKQAIASAPPWWALLRSQARDSFSAAQWILARPDCGASQKFFVAEGDWRGEVGRKNRRSSRGHGNHSALFVEGSDRRQRGKRGWRGRRKEEWPLREGLVRGRGRRGRGRVRGVGDGRAGGRKCRHSLGGDSVKWPLLRPPREGSGFRWGAWWLFGGTLEFAAAGPTSTFLRRSGGSSFRARLRGGRLFSGK